MPICEAFGRPAVHRVLAGSKTRKVKVHVCVGQENRYSNPNGENTLQLLDILCSRCIDIRLAVSVFSILR
jgi:hypothetical protein